MSEDIVTRLEVAIDMEPHEWGLLADAKKEIERLRAETKRTLRDKIRTTAQQRDEWRDKYFKTTAEIERLRRDGNFLFNSLQWAMEGREVPEDMADVMNSWQEARRRRSEATEIVETMLEAGMEW